MAFAHATARSPGVVAQHEIAFLVDDVVKPVVLGARSRAMPPSSRLPHPAPIPPPATPGPRAFPPKPVASVRDRRPNQPRSTSRLVIPRETGVLPSLPPAPPIPRFTRFPTETCRPYAIADRAFHAQRAASRSRPVEGRGRARRRRTERAPSGGPVGSGRDPVRTRTTRTSRLLARTLRDPGSRPRPPCGPPGTPRGSPPRPATAENRSMRQCLPSQTAGGDTRC